MIRTSFWLLPVREAQKSLQEVINTFADEFDAPRFVPHVTLHSGDCDELVAKDAIEAAFAIPRPSAICCNGLDTTEEISKTLFLSLKNCQPLDGLSAFFSTVAPSEYQFIPHLSLLYKPLTHTQRAELVQRTEMPLDSIRFDRVCAVATGGDLSVKDTVEKSWRVLAEAQLAPELSGLNV